MKQVLLITIPTGWQEWSVVFLLLAMLVVWIFTLVDIAQAIFNSTSAKLLWLLLVFLTGIIGVLIYRAWGTSQKATFGKEI